MVYLKSYKNVPPYCMWYSEIYSLKQSVEKRCVEIEQKYKELEEKYKNELAEEYKKGFEFGASFEQHNDPTLDICKGRNTELISLESNVKSTLEKTLLGIVKDLGLKGQKLSNESTILFYMRLIEEKIKMPNMHYEKGIIKNMIKERNKSEHEIDNLLRNIDVKYVHLILNASYHYMDKLIQCLYERK